MHEIEPKNLSQMIQIISGYTTGLDIDYNYYQNWHQEYANLVNALDAQAADHSEDETMALDVERFKDKFKPPYLNEKLKEYKIKDLLTDPSVVKDFIYSFNETYLDYNIEFEDETISQVDRMIVVHKYALRQTTEHSELRRKIYTKALSPRGRSREKSQVFITNATRGDYVDLTNISMNYDRGRFVDISLTKKEEEEGISFQSIKDLSKAVIITMYTEFLQLIVGYEEAMAEETFTEEELIIQNTPYTFPRKNEIIREAIAGLVEKYPHLQELLELSGDVSPSRTPRIPFEGVPF